MKGTYWLAIAVISFAGCKSCGDEPTENNQTNNIVNNASNNSNNATNNNTTVPLECTPEYEYTDWNVKTDRRLIKACSPYIADDSIEVTEGSVLTIDPGVELRHAPDSWLRVRDGLLVANGTEDDPILFTTDAASPDAGSWLGVRITGEAQSGNEISHAIIEYGGRDQFGSKGCLFVEASVGEDRVTLTDTTFRTCAQAGLAAPAPAFAEIAGLSFEDMDYGMSLGADTVGRIAEAFTYTDVASNQITTANVTESATWVSQGIPYRVEDSLEVSGEADPMLTLDAGLELSFNSQIWLRVGNGDDGGLTVNGTEADPVVMESAAGTQAPGDWLGIRYAENVLAESSINYLVMRHAGADQFGTRGCVTLASTPGARVSIDNSTFEQCLQAGVAAIDEPFTFGSFTNNVFRDSTIGMHLAPNAISSIGAQTFESVDANRIEGKRLTTSGTWVAQDVPWRVTDSIEIGDPSNPVLTLEAGGVYQFEGGAWVRVGNNDGGSIVAQGTAADPVVFQSSAGTTAAGDWLGLRFAANTLSGTLLEYVTIEHAGQDQFGMRGSITIDGANAGRIAIRNSTFGDCAQACIAVTNSDFQFAEVTSNTFRDSAYALSFPPNAINGLTDGQTYTNVPANRLDGDTLTATGTWVKQSVPWDVAGSWEVGDDAGAPTLTIEAGNVFRHESGSWLRVGVRGTATLVVNGTAGDPVVFTSRQGAPSAGDWLGIRLDDVSNGTLLDNIVMEYAGEDTFGQNGAVHLNSTGTAVTISNSSFSNNLQADIWIDSNSTPTLSNNGGAVVVNQ